MSVKVYKSAKSKWNNYFLFGTIFFLFAVNFPVFFEEDVKAIIVVTSINFVLIAFLLWIFYDTKYTIKSTIIYWKSGLFHGKFDIKTIKKIEHHKGIVVPTVWKPALSHIGLVITYNKYDDIYISPENEEEFLKHLLEINPNIEII